MPARAKGRMLPSGLSRSRQYAALSIFGKALYPLLMANADDQGRLPADADRVKWAVCPNVPEIPTERIPDLLAEMQRVGLAIIYDDGPEPVIQLTQWWEDQSSMEWAYPSEFAPHQNWQDRLRIRGSHRVLTVNWPGTADSDRTTLATELPRQLQGSPALADALGLPRRVSDAHPTPVRQHEHEGIHEVQGYPPPTPPQAPPAQRPHAGQGRGKEKTKEAPHGRVRRRRIAADPRSPRLPWREVAGND